MSNYTPLHGPLGWAMDFGIDRPALGTILRLWLPASRVWAAALDARGDAERFIAAVPLARPPRSLKRRLAAFEVRRLAYEAAAADWEAALFADASTDARVQAELRRARAALALTSQRARFIDLVMRKRVPAAQFEIPSPEAVDTIYGYARGEPWRLYTPSTIPTITESGRVPSRHGDDYWLRFPSPSSRLGGLAWARVREPRGVVDPPTVIFGNGVFVEFDHFGDFVGSARPLLAHGIRIVEIESPWHGRRRMPGRYGGEPFLGTAPRGPIDLFSAQAQELAVLVEWCRRSSHGPVALAGASMGALAAGLAASHAAHWPKSMRPDALMMLTAADDIVGLASDSTLTRGIGLTEALAAAGWSEETLRRWRDLGMLAPSAPLPPERIVAVLGRRDSILPFASGEALMARWQLPPTNLFIAGGGHFAAHLGILLDPRPLRRLREILCAIRY